MLQADHSMIAVGFAQRAAMIADNPIVLRSGQLQEGMMAGCARHLRIVISNIPLY
jgi:hypothetical protein